MRFEQPSLSMERGSPTPCRLYPIKMIVIVHPHMSPFIKQESPQSSDRGLSYIAGVLKLRRRGCCANVFYFFSICGSATQYGQWTSVPTK